jgi:hypothetical protein
LRRFWTLRGAPPMWRMWPWLAQGFVLAAQLTVDGDACSREVVIASTTELLGYDPFAASDATTAIHVELAADDEHGVHARLDTGNRRRSARRRWGGRLAVTSTLDPAPGGNKLAARPDGH